MAITFTIYNSLKLEMFKKKIKKIGFVVFKENIYYIFFLSTTCVKLRLVTIEFDYIVTRMIEKVWPMIINFSLNIVHNM